MTAIRHTRDNLRDLHRKAEQLPGELKPFGLGVVQVLAQLYGLIGVRTIVRRLEGETEEEHEEEWK